MIQWLIQTIDVDREMAQGRAPSGLLSLAETTRLGQLRCLKRRHDWLLGRWTAKQLVRSYIEGRTGLQPALDTIVINSAQDGAPMVSLSTGWSRNNGPAGPYREQWTRLPALNISISHSHNHAFCALSDQPGAVVGVDIERITARPALFAEDYFTPDELARLQSAPASLRDTLTTAIWSAKEAALKALRLGLTVDTRQVSCALEWAPGHEWSSFMVKVGPCRAAAEAGLPAAARGSAQAPLELAGWWRIAEPFVLTMVVKLHA